MLFVAHVIGILFVLKLLFLKRLYELQCIHMQVWLMLAFLLERRIGAKIVAVTKVEGRR
jgi:hypothetical protein